MVDIIITIPNQYVDELKVGIFYNNPKPDGISDIEHIKNIIKQYLREEYRNGKIQLMYETINPENEYNEDIMND